MNRKNRRKKLTRTENNFTTKEYFFVKTAIKEIGKLINKI